jgi:hypothetical protein
MTKRHYSADLGAASSTREHDAQQEIDNFLKALSSYPDRFAREPYLSFQQHLSSIVATGHSPSPED